MKININGITRDMTIEEQAEMIQQSAQEQIAALKQQLTDTDYKAIKYAEGWITEADYAPIKAERQALRGQINALEGM
jgi:hypothetical protein